MLRPTFLLVMCTSYPALATFSLSVLFSNKVVIRLWPKVDSVWGIPPYVIEPTFLLSSYVPGNKAVTFNVWSKREPKNSFENLIAGSSQEDVPSTNAFYVQSSYKALDYSLD